MSWTGTAWASKQTAGSPVNKCVLMMLADATSHDNPILVVRIATLSIRCEANEATIRRSLSALEASGLIARIDRFQDNVQRACGYVLMHPENADRLPWIVDDANRNTGFFHALRVGGALCEGTLANGGEGAHSARGEGAQKRNPEQEGSFHDECDKSGTSLIEPKKRSIFSPPTESEWVGYCRSTWADWHTSADAWTHYQAVGWVAGKAKIKDWKAAARTSHSRAKEWGKLGQPTNEHDEFWRNFKR